MYMGIQLGTIASPPYNTPEPNQGPNQPLAATQHTSHGPTHRTLSLAVSDPVSASTQTKQTQTQTTQHPPTSTAFAHTKPYKRVRMCCAQRGASPDPPRPMYFTLYYIHCQPCNAYHTWAPPRSMPPIITSRRRNPQKCPSSSPSHPFRASLSVFCVCR
ncbi:hypothetical protein BT67DRAFT_208987 [Trichocladium antarcticum]|uniref:Uncharacterized protein n=1 Tax=Trichocladium antarcticum TaxID=1450529 RepID=A0AAN6UD28_9PEZI|nr:hypothetical protein BT67DRAFT_208987 [Trichocladium antarcticum]